MDSLSNWITLGGLVSEVGDWTIWFSKDGPST